MFLGYVRNESKGVIIVERFDIMLSCSPITIIMLGGWKTSKEVKVNKSKHTHTNTQTNTHKSRYVKTVFRSKYIGRSVGFTSYQGSDVPLKTTRKY